jgi:hypothetical protein
MPERHKRRGGCNAVKLKKSIVRKRNSPLMHVIPRALDLSKERCGECVKINLPKMRFTDKRERRGRCDTTIIEQTLANIKLKVPNHPFRHPRSGGVNTFGAIPYDLFLSFH